MKTKLVFAIALLLAALLCGCADAPAAPYTVSPAPALASPGPAATPQTIDDVNYIGISRAAALNDDEFGIRLTAQSVTPSELRLICTQSGGETAREYATGRRYGLQTLKDGEWKDVDPLPNEYGEIIWTDEALLIAWADDTVWDIDWEYIYGELPPGRYRLSKSVFEAEGDAAAKQYYAYFDILDKAQTQFISYAHDNISISLPYSSAWEYTIEEYAKGCTSFGISIRPRGYIDSGYIHLHYHYGFGVCGTGLEEKEFGAGRIGYYDGSDAWSYIYFPAAGDGAFVALADQIASWYPRYGDAALEMISGATFGGLN